MREDALNQQEFLNLARAEVPGSDALQQSILQTTRAMPQQIPPFEVSQTNAKSAWRIHDLLFSTAAWRGLSAPATVIAGVVIMAVSIALFVPLKTPREAVVSDGGLQQLELSQIADEDELVWQELLLMQDELAFNSFTDSSFAEL